MKNGKANSKKTAPIAVKKNSPKVGVKPTAAAKPKPVKEKVSIAEIRKALDIIGRWASE